MGKDVNSALQFAFFPLDRLSRESSQIGTYYGALEQGVKGEIEIKRRCKTGWQKKIKRILTRAKVINMICGSLFSNEQLIAVRADRHLKKKIVIFK